MSKKSTEVVDSIEYGYRLPDGTHVWQIDHGSDGTWIPARGYAGKLIPAIDIDERVPHMEMSERIALVLQGIVNGGHIMAREVRTVRDPGPIEWAEVETLPVSADV